MNEVDILVPNEFPPLLREIDDPPEKLYIRGQFPKIDNAFLCVVGSRKYTSYGREVCEKLIAGLRGYPIVIVSGLALGIDAIAHTAALAAGLTTVAVPGSGLDWSVLYPRTNHALAKKILAAGGALVSEYEPEQEAAPWSFPQRNRLMAGLANATLVIEAQKKSGTLITARLAMEYNRDVLAVPGSIFSASTDGTHALIKDGATPAISSADILSALDIAEDTSSKVQDTSTLSENEKKMMKLLHEPLSRDELIRSIDMPVNEANILLSTMELKGLVVERLGKISTL